MKGEAMIKAQEALMITMSANKIKRLEDQIRLAATRGEFEIMPQITLDASDRVLLMEHGYKINRRMVRPSPGFGCVDNDDNEPDVEQITINWSR